MTQRQTSTEPEGQPPLYESSNGANIVDAFDIEPRRSAAKEALLRRVDEAAKNATTLKKAFVKVSLSIAKLNNPTLQNEWKELRNVRWCYLRIRINCCGLSDSPFRLTTRFSISRSGLRRKVLQEFKVKGHLIQLINANNSLHSEYTEIILPKLGTPSDGNGAIKPVKRFIEAGISDHQHQIN